GLLAYAGGVASSAGRPPVASAANWLFVPVLAAAPLLSPAFSPHCPFDPGAKYDPPGTSTTPPPGAPGIERHAYELPDWRPNCALTCWMAVFGSRPCASNEDISPCAVWSVV